jgi:hypothetical protein
MEGIVSIDKIIKSSFFVIIVFSVAYGTAQKLPSRSDLHERARANGGNLVITDPSSGGLIDYSSLKDLAHASDLVVLGIAEDNRCGLTKSGSSIVTTYKVRITQSLRGRAHKSDVVNVTIPGGEFAFPDGSVARINMPNYPRLVNGRSYVLFLSGDFDQNDFSPTGGPRGVFLLQDDGKVRAHSRPDVHALSSMNGMDHSAFMRHIQNAIKEDDDDRK